MKGVTNTIWICFLGIGLIAATYFARGFFQTAEIPALCNSEHVACVALRDSLRPLTDAAFTVKRTKFSKSELPILDIYMNNGALAKLKQKREETLNKPGVRQVLTKSKDDWVKAKVIADDGTSSEEKVSLRLKGDWTDHIEDPMKISFRIKVRKGGYVFGLKHFSIQHPKTRAYQIEPLLLEHMTKHDVIAPRYKFVDVRINGYKIGLMALEEHFSKELVEHRNRREGPILARSEDLWWQQVDLNLRVNNLGWRTEIRTDFNLYHPTDSPVKEFREKEFNYGTIATNNSIRSRSLFRDYTDGKVAANKVFDLELVAKWWVLTNIWNGCHGASGLNRRFYFNPINGLLEPISFDNGGLPRKYSSRGKSCDDFAVARLKGLKEFQQEVTKFSTLLDAELRSEDFIGKLDSRQDFYRDLMAIERMESPKVTARQLQENFAIFSEWYSEYLDNRKTFSEGQLFSGPRRFPFQEKVKQADLEFTSHIATSFRFNVSEKKTALRISNLLGDKIEILTLEYVDPDRSLRTIDINQVLDPLSKNQDGVLSMPIAPLQLPSDFREAQVNYRYSGKPYSEPVVTEFVAHDTGFEDGYEMLASSDKILVDEEAKTLLFLSSDYVFDSSLEVSADWTLVFSPGATVTFNDGALLKVNGAVHIAGTQEQPVIFTVSSNPDYQGMGSWGGVFVNGSRPSTVRYATFYGNPSVQLDNRQDYYGMTGCITFYGTSLLIENATFSNMQCEDALNIVSSEFKMVDVLISEARADGFDSDFSIGEVLNSRFERTGNDGLDISGTKLKIDNLQFENIGDKAISDGERSELSGHNIQIDRANTGVVSKDDSDAKLDKVTFKGIVGSPLMTYIKKAEYGPARLACNNCSLEESLIANQYGSSIKVDNQSVAAVNFSTRQMKEAGYSE